MAEKKLNTIIILRNSDYNDTLKAKVLKAGEVVLCKVGTTEASGNVSEPIYMMKIGDGEKSVSALPWLVAPAADVHAWAKKSSLDANDLPIIPGSKLGIEISVDGDGNAITNVEYDATTKKFTFTKGLSFSEEGHTHTDAQVTCTDYEGKTLVNVIKNDLAKKSHTHKAADITDFSEEVNKVIVDAGVATDEALATMGGRVTKLEEDSATHATKTELNTAKNTLNTAIGYVTGGLNMTTNTNATNKALDERVSAVEADLGVASSDGVDATGLHADVESLDARLTTLDGAVNGIGGIEKRLVTVAGKVTTLEGEMDTAQADIEELKNTVTGLEGAMHFVGVSSTDPLGESGATVEGEDGFVAGDVVLYDGKEYIYDLNDKWILFGDEGSYLTKTEAASTYLAKSDASATYLAKEDAASIYHTIEEAHSEHEALTGLINGKVDSSAYATDKAALEKADSDNLQAAKDYTDEKLGDVDLSGIEANAEAINKINDTSTGILATSKSYTNQEVGKVDEKVTAISSTVNSETMGNAKLLEILTDVRVDLNTTTNVANNSVKYITTTANNGLVVNKVSDAEVPTYNIDIDDSIVFILDGNA